MSLEGLKALLALQAEDDNPQARGLGFEKWLIRSLEDDDLNPRLNLRPSGEQIDGSFVLHGAVMLIEAKWRKDPIPASDIYAFKGKVDGKLVGTIGFFMSMSGYSEDAVDAVRAGKIVNVLLFGDRDLLAGAKYGFREVFNFKLRMAAEVGEIFSPFTASLRSDVGDAKDEVMRRSLNELREMEHRPPLAIIVEGSKEETIVTIFCNRILEEASVGREFAVFVANGRYGLASVANGMSLEFPDAKETIIVTDGQPGSTPEDWEETIRRSVAHPERTRIVVAPQGVGSWLGMSKPLGQLTIPDIWKRAQEVNLTEILAIHPSLQQLRSALVEEEQFE